MPHSTVRLHRFLLAAAGWALAVSLAATGCTSASESEGAPDTDQQRDTAADTSEDTGPVDGGDTASDGDTAADTAPDILPPKERQVIHQFPKYELEPGEEVVPCVQWSIGNEKPIYVNRVTLANGGGFHHSNWFVVPKDYAAGEDGYFDCSERGFGEFTAATKGTVLFAQSTQAKSETQKFPEGAVIKIPPHHKIVADVHFLNIQTRPLETFARMTLGLTHPRNVDVVLTPFRLTYHDLDIPPNSEARFTGECEVADSYESTADNPYDLELYYVLPHYHGLGNYFDLELLGGPRDGEQIFELNGFNAEANGKAFEPPIDLSGSNGFRFTCGYDNPRDESVGWGLGNQEMCVMLGFADSDLLIDARVQSGNEVVKRENGIVYNEGPCTSIVIPKSDNQDMPDESERKGRMYVPEGDDDGDLDPIPECEDAPDSADPIRPPTLTNLHNDIFSVSCAFSACHGAESPQAGLNLAEREGLHDRLMNHEVLSQTNLPLVDPGNSDGSWLHRRTSECRPETTAGTTSHMPRNSPTLLDPGVVAMIREWIARGAKDN